MKYKAIFLRKIGEYKRVIIRTKEEKKVKSETIRPNYVKVAEKSFSPLDEFIELKKDYSYPVQLEGYSFQDNDTLYYYYDYDDMHLIGLETLLKYNMKPKDLNKITGKKIVEQIVAGAKTVQSNPLIYILLPIGIGIVMLLIGYWMGGGFNG